MADSLWDLLDNFPYLNARRAKPNAPAAQRAKSTYSAISALCDVKSNPRKCTLSTGFGVTSVGVTVHGKTKRKKVLVNSLGAALSHTCAPLLPASTRLYTWRFSTLAVAVILWD